MDKKDNMEKFLNIQDKINDKILEINDKAYLFRVKLNNYINIIRSNLIIFLIPINIISLIISLYYKDYYIFILILIGTEILYLNEKLNYWLNHKREKELIQLLDINLISKDSDKKISLSDILDQYISSIFERDILFFKGIGSQEYINTKLENELLRELLDRVSISISPILRQTLLLYYPDNTLDTVIGRKCYTIVSIFAANHNKGIYVKQPL